MNQDKVEDTRRRAYAIWEAEGRPEGRDKEHWAQAESEGRANPGFAEAQQRFSAGEQPGPGAPGAGSGPEEAAPHSGDGAPDSGKKRQPIAASPGGASETGPGEGADASAPGAHTGP